MLFCSKKLMLIASIKAFLYTKGILISNESFNLYMLKDLVGPKEYGPVNSY